MNSSREGINFLIRLKNYGRKIATDDCVTAMTRNVGNILANTKPYR